MSFDAGAFSTDSFSNDSFDFGTLGVGLSWPDPSQDEGNIVGGMLAEQIAALGIPAYAFDTAIRAALAEVIAVTSPSPPSVLTWPDPSQDENDVVGGRLSEQIRSLGIPAYAFETALRAALAEVIARSGASAPTVLDWPAPSQAEGNIVGSKLSEQIKALGIPQYAFETAIRAALAEVIASS